MSSRVVASDRYERDHYSTVLIRKYWVRRTIYMVYLRAAFSRVLGHGKALGGVHYNCTSRCQVIQPVANAPMRIFMKYSRPPGTLVIIQAIQCKVEKITIWLITREPD